MNLNENQIKQFLERTQEISSPNHHYLSDALLDDIVTAWKALQFAPGSVVLLLLQNSHALLKHVFALFLAGYVPALVAPTTPVNRINKIAQSFNTKAIIKSTPFTRDIDNVSQSKKIDKHDILILNNTNSALTLPGELILTTSGTSGFSSGCIFDFGALLRNAENMLM